MSQASMQIMGEFAELQLSTSEGESDNAICPKCGVAYTDSEGLWVCCDGCDRWFNVECTTIKIRNYQMFTFVKNVQVNSN